jgi:anaphase-promoting complex subunit 1
MIMLGKGSSIPADLALLSRLTVLVHGDTNSLLGKKTRPPFDINLTSPAATIALGLMYLRTERQDVADILTIPDTVLTLNRIQPSFLLMRTLARSLIMWNSITPTNEWLATQVPRAIANAMEARFQGKSVDDALELAYYNILAGCCFVVGLKYAGTARQEAWLMITSYFELFRRLAYSNG